MAMKAVAPAASTALDNSLQILLPAVVDVVNVAVAVPPYPSLAAPPPSPPALPLPLLLSPMLIPLPPPTLPLPLMLPLEIPAASTLASNTWSGGQTDRVRVKVRVGSDKKATGVPNAANIIQGTVETMVPGSLTCPFSRHGVSSLVDIHMGRRAHLLFVTGAGHRPAESYRSHVRVHAIAQAGGHDADPLEYQVRQSKAASYDLHAHLTEQARLRKTNDDRGGLHSAWNKKARTPRDTSQHKTIRTKQETVDRCVK